MPPIIKVFDTLDEEQAYLLKTIEDLTNGSPADSICVVTRTHRQIEENYLPALRQANINYLYLKANIPDDAGTGVRLATMHRVKGLEFQTIVIVGANDEYLPLKSMYKDETYEKEDELLERCLLHVASTRARDKLYISCFGEPSRFLI